VLSQRDRGIAIAVAVLTLAFFIVTLRPDVGGTEDSPKFQFVGRVLGTSHSPGYPFYSMATWAFGYLAPIGTLAYRINLFSAVCGALACACIFLTARRLGVTRLLSVAAALAAATSYPLWSNSITAEVYALAAVLSAAAIYFVIGFAQTGAVRRLFAGCLMWACGFGNHLTIVGILPAALIYGIYRNRAVLRPAIAIPAALIGLAGVLQYAFIAIRTLQGAPYLEARATTIRGVFDVIIALDVKWARFYQAQSAVAQIEIPMLLNGIRVNMGTIAVLLVAWAIVDGIRKRNAEVLLIAGAAAGTLAMIANLWGDVVGFITPVCVQLWPLAAFGWQRLAIASTKNPAAVTAAGVVAVFLPIAHAVELWPRIEALRQPGEGPGVRALYANLPARSAIVAENYWLARLIDYMHFSGEYSPDPNPRVLDSDVAQVRTALADGLEVYAFEGATHWLGAQGFRFEPAALSRQPFETWLAAQPPGTLVVAATAGRPLPSEWLPKARRSPSGRPANYNALALVTGEAEVTVAEQDSLARIDRRVGAEGRMLSVMASDDGPLITWGDDVIVAVDRGLAAAAFSPEGLLVGQWAFAVDERPSVQLPPTPFVLRGERTCVTLQPGRPTDVAAVLADGGWLATADQPGTAAITVRTAAAPATWRHRVSNGRGDAWVDAGNSRALMTGTTGTRAVFALSMPATPAATATLEPGEVTSVRVCSAATPRLPATGALDVGPDRDWFFGAGWHLGERAGTQRFRWSAQSSSLVWRMDDAQPVRVLLRVRAAHAHGATLQASIDGRPLAACPLPAGRWADCRIDVPAEVLRAGINRLTVLSDTFSPSADRPGDPRQLAFVMQASRVRVGQ
jgi:hypothetical protein